MKSMTWVKTSGPEYMSNPSRIKFPGRVADPAIDFQVEDKHKWHLFNNILNGCNAGLTIIPDSS
ncbi:MAG: hypothetical protein JW736_05330, partial [Deltaproteobacteria bacterium]|nr:hypothetical protein [Deltaproteobacteria bacterium]